MLYRVCVSHVIPIAQTELRDDIPRAPAASAIDGLGHAGMPHARILKYPHNFRVWRKDVKQRGYLGIAA